VATPIISRNTPIITMGRRSHHGRGD